MRLVGTRVMHEPKHSTRYCTLRTLANVSRLRIMEDMKKKKKQNKTKQSKAERWAPGGDPARRVQLLAGVGEAVHHS